MYIFFGSKNIKCGGRIIGLLPTYMEIETQEDNLIVAILCVCLCMLHMSQYESVFMSLVDQLSIFPFMAWKIRCET